MAQNLAYNYAEIDLETGMCIGVQTTSADSSGDPALIEIPVYDEEYIMKYYNQANGNWYEDAGFTIPWQSALLSE